MADTPWELLWNSADQSPDPQQTRREAWGRYVASREWAILKRRVFQRAEGRCEFDGVRAGTQLHHLTYERRFHEELEDVMLVCLLCHLYLSGKIDLDPRVPPPLDDLTAA